MAASSRKCRDLLEYLKTLPPGLLEQLYNHPATCIAVYRELPAVAKHFVARMLFVNHAVPKSVVQSWVAAGQHAEHQTACAKLLELRVWNEQQLPGGGLLSWTLNETFRKHFKIALLGGGKPGSAAQNLSNDKHAKDASFLEKYALERWECVLHFMVGSREATQGVSRDVVDVLLRSGLMKGEVGDTAPGITQAGFQFLLMDTASQVWYFMLEYLELVEAKQMSLAECLSFLFQLSFSTLGKDYPADNLSPSQLKLLQHLREFGLVYQRKRTSHRFYPTSLAINLALGVTKTNSDVHRNGFIVVETNYRVYAYTDSSLQVALLGLFCDMLYRFPNLSVANITRDSVRQALINGISADQIITFLATHAHPQMLAQKPLLPPTIVDQIRLWELERERFKFEDGVLYNQFLSQSDYELLRDYARDIGVLMLENAQRRTIVVTRTGHDDVKKFWKRQKKGD